MKSALSLLALIYGAYASNVLDLVPETFDKTVFAGTPALVELYAFIGLSPLLFPYMALSPALPLGGKHPNRLISQLL